jgi:DNA polymerase-3 subunit delta
VIYIFHGADQFRAREELQQLRRRLDRDGNLAYNTLRLEGKDLTPATLRSATHSASFFAEPRLVIVDGLQEKLRGSRRRGRSRATAGAETASESDQFVEVLANVPESSTVVLLDETEPKGLTEALGDRARVTLFAPLKGASLRDWAAARVKGQGGTILPSALDRLLMLVDGHHLGELAGEIDKLVTYASGRTISVEDIDLLVSASMQFEFWDLTDAVIEGRTQRALSVYRAMDDKERPLQVRAFLLVRQFRQLLLAQALSREGLSADQVGSKLGLTGYPLRKALDQAGRFQPERLEAAYRRLLASDVAVKTGVLDIEVSLELLIIELCELARPAAGGRSGGRPVPTR